jgi:titin
MAGDNNVFEGNKIVGLAQFDNGAHHRAGGLTPAAVNVVSNIAVLASDSTIQGNIAATIGISGHGNLIGGLTPAARNVIGPGFHGGLNLNGPGNTVQGNYIGTDVTGTIRNHSRDGGIVIRGDGNLIGGTAPGARNIISGNERGIYIFDASNNIIQGNWIGLDATGQATLYNGDGITITSFSNNSTGNLIGGTEPGAGNVISGNNGDGISLFLGVSNTTIQGNLIGVLPDGVTAAGNNVAGVFVSSDATNNLIGGSQPGAGNVIAYSRGLPGAGTGSGVVIARYDTIIPTNDAVLGNRIFGNAALGIDLSPTQDQGSDGVTPNDLGDADSGPNGIQNFPVLSSAATTASGTTVTGTLDSNPNATFQIQFFSSATADPSGHGEGERFLGMVTVTTNGSGDASFSALLPAVAPGQVVSATATSATNDTSEFSAAVPVSAGASKKEFFMDDLNSPPARAASTTGRSSLVASLFNDGDPVLLE